MSCAPRAHNGNAALAARTRLGITVRCNCLLCADTPLMLITHEPHVGVVFICALHERQHLVEMRDELKRFMLGAK